MESKTQPSDAAVETFLEGAPRSADAKTLTELMEEISGEPATMWGPSIVGFGRYRYTYESGRSGEMCRIGFSPRKAALTLYLASDTPERPDLLAKLGRHTTGKACVYIKALADVDMAVLRELIAASLADNRRRWP
jgi:Domain of unknown function (DU1801)